MAVCESSGCKAALNIDTRISTTEETLTCGDTRNSRNGPYEGGEEEAQANPLY
jgi:hypothetical protein